MKGPVVLPSVGNTENPAVAMGSGGEIAGGFGWWGQTDPRNVQWLCFLRTDPRQSSVFP